MYCEKLRRIGKNAFISALPAHTLTLYTVIYFVFVPIDWIGHSAGDYMIRMIAVLSFHLLLFCLVLKYIQLPVFFDRAKEYDHQKTKTK